MPKIVKKFKGGSLSSTNLMMNEKGDLFVRKTVSLVENREYGFQRWYSQLKRLQRYSVMFPGMFPKILKFGKDADMAFFDIEYFEDAVNAQEYIENCQDSSSIDQFFKALIETISRLHRLKIDSNTEAMDLYIYEEIDQRLKDCNNNQSFTDFLKYETIIFNGVPVKSFLHVIDEYKSLCQKYYTNTKEVFTHGNITLENTLFIPNDNRVILIDPYEENVIDSELAEFSQLLQSTNSKYEIYNREHAYVEGNKITLKIPQSFGVDYLNQKLFDFLRENYQNNDIIAIRLLEISQFIRMLPFKMAVDESKMIFFYGLASYLFATLKNDYNL